MKKDKRISKRISKRVALIFLLSVVLSMWAGLDICAQRIKYTYDNAGNRLTRQKEIVVQTRGALSDEEEPSVYEEELSETKVTIYPNPTRGMLKIDISGVEKFENARISLYDLTGKLLQQWAGISQSNEIDLSERTPGMYIMQVAYNGKISSWKIIKE
ncbi:T9SS type A sorting domain-containing protein [Bacteroides cellulosilyticus]|uniref:T9SS type A sorting domain-containing protein n=1 Tax=Bacteroides cellulosilyticus TaxID=246787 RepID=UPI001C377208|nr:T9SS type A sorting domain-containing protein [Bacteroides cellulosilyticus]MBV3637717.1 T9SS type A sorting domain-containing protein [Bacteroides cellulosilyticus]MBV3664058.1 T9SS type A sorting domain-containing protein [Bacteroides cellulosilyticus]MBV3685960.1 T9SS type A sorting domain-containing protein [Bacteroides cellulosilyticus]MBV3694637.1 T9SS type A sorting domain-containing protein [Bacteroides cellulosilyticus]MBV3708257.1 T9SS type A sorting domain-containing protein [Bac